MTSVVLFFALCGADCPGGVCRVPAKAATVAPAGESGGCTKTRKGFHPFRRLFGKRGCRGC